MKNQILKLQFLLFLCFSLVFVACDKEETLSDTDVQNFTDQALFSLQDEASSGKHGCYELVFPIAISLGDEEISIDSYLDLKEALIAWKQSNPSTTDVRPQFVYPIDLMDDEGNIYTAEEPGDLAQYRKLCLRPYFQNNGWNGHGDRPMACFRLVFPVTIELPSGILVTAQTKLQLRNILKTWKEQQEGEIDERPSLAFPINVFMIATGTVEEVESKEALKALKEDCAD